MDILAIHLRFQWYFLESNKVPINILNEKYDLMSAQHQRPQTSSETERTYRGTDWGMPHWSGWQWLPTKLRGEDADKEVVSNKDDLKRGEPKLKVRMISRASMMTIVLGIDYQECNKSGDSHHSILWDRREALQVKPVDKENRLFSIIFLSSNVREPSRSISS